MTSLEGKCDIDVWPELQKLTADVISRAAFGSNYEEGERIFKLLKELVVLVIEAMQTLYLPGFRLAYTDNFFVVMRKILVFFSQVLQLLNNIPLPSLLGLSQQRKTREEKN